jgi:long-subunit acyl-CoA synthetase (AMP-forming)
MSYLLPLQQFSQRVKLNPDQPYLHQPVDSLWNTYSFKDVDTMARKIASGLLDQGYQKGIESPFWRKTVLSGSWQTWQS